MRFLTSPRIFTPGPGEWAAVRLPRPLFPLYRLVRLSRLAARLVSARSPVDEDASLRQMRRELRWGLDRNVRPLSLVKSVHHRASEKRNEQSGFERAESIRGNTDNPREQSAADVGQHEHERADQRGC